MKREVDCWDKERVGEGRGGVLCGYRAPPSAATCPTAARESALRACVTAPLLLRRQAYAAAGLGNDALTRGLAPLVRRDAVR